MNNGVGRSCACSLVLGLKSAKAKNVLYRFVFKVAKIQLEPLWISTNGGAKSCRQGRTKRDVGASSFCFGWLKAVDKADKKGPGASS